MDDSERKERFTALYRRHHTAVFAYALRRVGPDQAHDVVAETFVAAWRELERLPENVMPWLYRTAFLRVCNLRRAGDRQRRVAARAGAQPCAPVPDHAATVVDGVRVRRALRRLSETDREALMLTSWEDLSNADAAVVAGCSPAAFKVRLMRARRRFSRALDEPFRVAFPALNVPPPARVARSVHDEG